MMLTQLIRRRNVRLIYVNGPRWLPAGVLAARLSGRPVLFHLHLTLRRTPEVVLVAFLARFAAKVVACSNAAAKPLVETSPPLGRKIQVLYNPVLRVGGVDPICEGSAKTPGRFTLGMVGRTTESKGHMQLINAVGKLPPELQEHIRLVFVGAPSPGNVSDLAYAQRVRHRIAELNFQNRVTWAGYQTDPCRFYTAMDVLVQPSSHEAGEGMPMAILEAFREGLPVIASQTGGNPEIVEDGVNGLLFPVADEAALVRALRRFLTDRLLRARLRAGARATLTDLFSGEHFQSTIRSLVKEVVSRGTKSQVRQIPKELAAWK